MKNLKPQQHLKSTITNSFYFVSKIMQIMIHKGPSECIIKVTQIVFALNGFVSLSLDLFTVKLTFKSQPISPATIKK